MYPYFFQLLTFCFSDRNKKKEERCRECRSGCGIETSHLSCNTPGWEVSEVDYIQHDRKRDIKFLKLKRSEERMKQTSTTMLQSWRANCDVAILIYDTDPVHLSPSDVAKVSNYIVSYCTKGNVSFQQERDTIAAIVEKTQSDYAGMETPEVIRMTRQILNSFMGTRIISKGEASVEMLSLDLYWCTETIRHIRLSKTQRLTTSSNSNNDTISKYSMRGNQYKHLSLKQYIELLHDKKRKTNFMDAEHADFSRIRKVNKKLKEEVIHPIGMNCNPVFPVTGTYARGTLLMNKPWSQHSQLLCERNFSAAEKEFYSFLYSDKCPLSVQFSFSSAYLSSKRGQRFKEPTSDHIRHDMDVDNVEDEDLAEYLRACKDSRQYSGYSTFYKGEDGKYDFQTQYSNMDRYNKDGNWLIEQKLKEDEQPDNTTIEPIINTRTRQPYSLNDMGDNKEQRDIVYTVVQKLKEWIEYPDKHMKDKSVTFQPLHMTVRGAGGTGKSHIIKILTNAVQQLFPLKVTTTCAPTGNAAFAVGGKTIHSFFKISPATINKPMRETQQQQLMEDVLHLLMIIIDERSLLSQEVLGAAERNCRLCAHKGKNPDKPWGGVPIILVFGDDYQLPSVCRGSQGCGATHIFPVQTQPQPT